MGVNLYKERLLVFRTSSSVESGDFDFREVPRIALPGLRCVSHHPSPPPICPSQNIQVQSADIVPLPICLWLPTKIREF